MQLIPSLIPSRWQTGRGRRSGEPGQVTAAERARWPWLLTAFFGVLMFAGGSSRWDSSSLLFLRPTAALLLVYFLVRLPTGEWYHNRFVMGMAGAIMLLPALQLVPLPPEIWHAVAGREIVQEIDAAIGLQGIWRPLSLDTNATWNALFSLLVPATIFVGGLSLGPTRRRAMAPLLLVMILASGFLGLLQIIGPNNGPFYLYRVTHGDSAVGFLANRNHQAALLACAFPIMAFLATDDDFRDGFFGHPLFLVPCVLFLVPLVLITGSRAGLAVTCFSIVCAAAIYWKGRHTMSAPLRRSLRVALLAVSGLGAVIVALTIKFGRAEALQRIFSFDSESDARFQAWQEIAKFLPEFLPWGTGFGTFSDVYKIYEPRALLDPTYFNQAHNDWLELVLLGGAPAVFILCTIIISIVWRTWKILSSDHGDRNDLLSLVGLSIILIFALASIPDYPLRVPLIAAVFAAAVVWALPIRSELIEAQSTGWTRASLFRPKHVVAILFALIAAVIVCRHAASNILSATAPQIARSLDPSNPVAITRAIDRELAVRGLDRPPLAHWAADAKRALRSQPLNASSLRTLGLIAAYTKDIDRARKLMSFANRLSRREGITQLWLSADAAKRNDARAAMTHLNTIMTTEVGAWPTVFPMTLQLLENPRIARQFAVIIRDDTPWLPSFLTFATTDNPQPQHLAAVVRLAGGLPADPRYRVHETNLLWQLANASQPNEARQLLLDLRRATPQLLSDGRFEQETLDQNLGPFAWTSTVSSDVDSYLEGNELVYVQVQPGKRVSVLQRLFALPPGRYRASAVVGTQLEGPRPIVELVARCASPVSTLNRSLTTIAGARERIDITFDVPVNCSMQWALFFVTAHESATKSDVVISNIVLTRQ